VFIKHPAITIPAVLTVAGLLCGSAVAQAPSTGSARTKPGVEASGQAYPNKPLRLIVPFPPGGGNDILARSVGQRLSEAIGQQIIVDNRGGAGGMIGAELAARAAPDGYTLFLASIGNLAFTPALHARLPYDPIKDFAPVTLLATSAFIMVVNPSVPAKSVKDLIALAKAKPGQLNYASAGQGSSRTTDVSLPFGATITRSGSSPARAANSADGATSHRKAARLASRRARSSRVSSLTPTSPSASRCTTGSSWTSRTAGTARRRTTSSAGGSRSSHEATRAGRVQRWPRGLRRAGRNSRACQPSTTLPPVRRASSLKM